MNATTTPTTPTTTLTLTGAQWCALASHVATERMNYAIEYTAIFPPTDKSREWIPTMKGRDGVIDAAGVVVATDGKRALYLPTDLAPSVVSLAALPKVTKSKCALSDRFPGATLPDGTDGRYFPPALDVIPAKGTGVEVPTDSLRAIFAPFATDPDNDTVRCWFGLGIRCASRSTVTDTSVDASWGTAPSDEADPIGLGARYVLDVCDAADLLGVALVTVQAKDHRSAVCFDLCGKGLAIVMPRVLG